MCCQCQSRWEDYRSCDEESDVTGRGASDDDPPVEHFAPKKASVKQVVLDTNASDVGTRLIRQLDQPWGNSRYCGTEVIVVGLKVEKSPANAHVCRTDGHASCRRLSTAAMAPSATIFTPLAPLVRRTAPSALRPCVVLGPSKVQFPRSYGAMPSKRTITREMERAARQLAKKTGGDETLSSMQRRSNDAYFKSSGGPLFPGKS